MKKNNIRYVVLAVIIFLTMPLLLSSCDEEKDLSEWEVSYVYIQRENWTAIPQMVLTHTPSGIEGNISQNFFVKVNKPVAEDITVHLAVSCTGFDAEKISLSQETVTIKANELCSDIIEVSCSDYEFMAKNKEEATYSVNISIKAIEPNSDEIRISDLQNTLAVNIVKKAFASMKYGEPTNSDRPNIRTDWKVEVLTSGVQGLPTDIIDGRTWTMLKRTDGNELEVTFDFGGKKDLLGVMAMHQYSLLPTKIEIFLSADGIDWKSYGTFEHSNTYNLPITFLSPVQTQHLKYKILESKQPGISLTEFYIYVPK